MSSGGVLAASAFMMAWLDPLRSDVEREARLAPSRLMLSKMVLAWMARDRSTTMNSSSASSGSTMANSTAAMPRTRRAGE
ncbi:hypothetical protein D3C72_1994310 [compost metagenome]